MYLSSCSANSASLAMALASSSICFPYWLLRASVSILLSSLAVSSMALTCTTSALAISLSSTSLAFSLSISLFLSFKSLCFLSLWASLRRGKMGLDAAATHHGEPLE